jgi:hypothetical protein
MRLRILLAITALLAGCAPTGVSDGNATTTAADLQQLRQGQAYHVQVWQQLFETGNAQAWDVDDLAALSLLKQIALQGSKVQNDDELIDLGKSACTPSATAAGARVERLILTMDHDMRKAELPPNFTEAERRAALAQGQSWVDYLSRLPLICEKTATIEQERDENAQREAEQQAEQGAMWQSVINAELLGASLNRR